MARSRIVLVAEDEDNDFFLLNRAFSKQDQQVSLTRVKDGVEAIHYLKGDNGFSNRREFPFPELLILDLKMPRKDGFDVLEWLQTSPYQKIIVVVLSSSREDRDVRRAYQLGAHSYLTKPNDSIGFVEITRILANYRFRCVERPERNGA